MGPSKLKLATDRSILRIENGTASDHTEDELFSVEEAINGSGVVGVFQAKLIVFCCFVWMARGVDEDLASYIGPLLSCDWNLERWQTAIVVTGSQVVSAFGCIVYGVWSDTYGRRTALSSSIIFVFVFGAVSAGLPSYTWYVVFRMVSAFAVGGLPQALTLVSEFTPRGQRGRVTFILSAFWAVGIIGMICLLYSTNELPEDWRMFVALSSIPSCIAMFIMQHFPESIRFLLVSNEDIAASIIMEEVASANKQNLPSGILEPAIDWKDRGHLSNLFSRATLRSTFLFCLMGLTTAVSYGGLTIIAPVILSDENGDVANITISEKNFLGDIHKKVECLPNITQSEFIETVWTTALDFPGILIYMILVDIINRKILLAASCTICAVFTFLLYIPTTNIITRTAFLYCSRTLLIPQFDLLLIMSAEAYPTTHRGTAVGLCASTFYVGFFINPYIYQTVRKMKYFIGFYGAVSLLTCIAGALLPLETRGRELMETPDDEK